MSFDTDDPAVIAQAGRDAADLVGCRWDEDDHGAGAVLDLCEPSLVADQLAEFTFRLLTASADAHAKIQSDPRRMLAGWRRSFGPEPATGRVPRPHQPARFRGDNARDAVALVEATAAGDEDAFVPILAGADHVAIAVHLAQIITRACHCLAATWPDGWRLTGQ